MILFATFALMVAACGLSLAGVYLLAGLPLALLCGGAWALAAALALRKGLSDE
jgi:hypothetical protein